MIDRTIDAIRSAGDLEVYRRSPCAPLSPIPATGTPAGDVLGAIVDLLEHGATGNLHPRFCGWAMSAGTLPGALAAFAASAFAVNAFGGDQASTHVELELLSWIRSLLGYPASSSGILVSGASVANLLGLYVAREARRRRRVLVTHRAHASIAKACRMLELEIVEPPWGNGDDLAIVATAGDVADGSFDDLEALAGEAQRRRAWLHVDAALGIAAALTPRLSDRLRSIDRADSIAFDFHKGLHAAPGTGGILVRDPRAHKAAFRRRASYLAKVGGGLGRSDVWFTQLGLEHTRRFSALEPWAIFRIYGVDGLRLQIERSVDQARRFAALVDESPDLERHGSVPFNIVRFSSRGGEAFDRALLAELADRGVAVFSPGEFEGRFVLRAAFFGHRTTDADVDALAAETARLVRARATAT